MSDAKAKAVAAKAKGNVSFKSGDFPVAIGHYTTAFLADPTDPTFPLNRAAAYLKLDKFHDAERDCTTALKLSAGGKNVKALFRRGQARMGLGRLEDAEKDFADALALEPTNVSAKQELERARKLQGKQSERKGTTSNTGVSTISATIPTLSAGVGSGSPPPKRRRVPIRIIGEQGEKDNGKEQKKEETIYVTGASSSSSTTSRKAKADNLLSDAKKHVEEDNDSGFLKPVSSRFISSSSASPVEASTSSSTKAGLSARGDQKGEDENKTKVMQKSSQEFLESIDEKKLNEDFESELRQALSMASASADGAKSEPKSKPTPGIKYTSSPSTSVSAASTKGGATTTTTADKSSLKVNDSFQKAKQAREASKPSRVGGGIFKASGESVIFHESSSSENKKSKDKEKVHEDEDSSRASSALPLAQAAAAAAIPSPATPAASSVPTRVPAPSKPLVTPQTLFEFSRMWDNALSSSKGKGKEEVVWDRWGLVCAIPPNQLPTLFKTSLEPSLLVSILDVFLKVLEHISSNPSNDNMEKARVLEYLTALAGVPRFNTLILFLSKPERMLSREVWAHLGINDATGVEDPKVRGVWRGIWS